MSIRVFKLLFQNCLAACSGDVMGELWGKTGTDGLRTMMPL